MAASTISYGDIKVSGYNFLSITTLRIVQEINEHTQMEITGLVPEDIGESYLQKFEINKSIEVKKMISYYLMESL